VYGNAGRGGRRGAGQIALPEIGQEIVRRVASSRALTSTAAATLGNDMAISPAQNPQIEDRIRRRGSARSAYLKIRDMIYQISGIYQSEGNCTCWLRVARGA